jgi:hypothetical protein
MTDAGKDLGLGFVRVPFETFYDGKGWVFRTAGEVAELFARWNQAK